MKIEGLKGIRDHLDNQWTKQHEDAESEARGRIEANLDDIGVQGVLHYEFTSVFYMDENDEVEDQEFAYYLVGADNKVITKMGTDTTPYKAWCEMVWYCQENGIDHDALEATTNKHSEWWWAAWRKKYPEKAAEHDRQEQLAEQQAEQAKENPNDW